MPANKHLKITFILPFVNLTGGIKILFEHANRLVERGHSITIVWPGKQFHGEHFETENQSWRWQYIEAPLRSLKYLIFVNILGKSGAEWYPLRKEIKLRRTPDLSNQYIPAADIVIATAPETVNWVAKYTPDKGIKIHFAQDYEAWYLPDDFLASTFSHQDMHLITIGTWQKKLYEERFGRKVDTIIPDGVDLSRFRPAGRKQYKEGTPVRVLLSYHHAAYKGIADGLEAIGIVRQTGHKVQVVMFGVHPLKDDVPSDVEYHHNVPEEDLPDLYRSCDIFLWPTHREGFGLPPLEAMACGTPVVGTDVGAMPDYMIDGKTGYIVPMKQPKQLGEKLLKLVADQKLRKKMGEAAAKAAEAWEWDDQTTKLESYLLELK